MLGIDEVLVIFAVAAAAKVVVEIGAELVGEWVNQGHRPVLDSSGGLPIQQLAEPGCLTVADGMFTTVADNVANAADCAAIAVIDCMDACPVMLKLVAH